MHQLNQEMDKGKRLSSLNLKTLLPLIMCHYPACVGT